MEFQGVEGERRAEGARERGVEGGAGRIVRRSAEGGGFCVR